MRISSISPGGTARAPREAERITPAGTADCFIISMSRGMWLRDTCLASHEEISADEWSQVTIEHASRITNFHFGTMILHELIRREHVRTNLRAEINVELGVFQLLRFRSLLFQLIFVELRT